MDYADPLIGRDSELKTLAEALSGTRPGLILIIGGPKTGKGRLLRELRVRAAPYPCRLVPADPADDEAAPWLVVDRNLSIDGFSQAIAPPTDVNATPDETKRRDFDLILVYGYRPARDFGDWFTSEFLRKGPGASPPRVVVVAGNAEDVAELDPLADGQVTLGPLPREAVAAELAAIDATISDRLEEPESELYAEAIASDPSLLASLRRLLPLTRAAQHTGEDSAMSLPPASHHGRCPCGGVYEDRTVEVRMTVEDKVVLLSDVPQGACPRCGSRVYEAGVLEDIEDLMHGRRPRARALL